LALFAIVSTLLFLRKPIDTTILRTPGMMYQETEDGYISNLYNLKLVNKTPDIKNIQIRIISPEEGRIRQVGGAIRAEGNSVVQSAFFVELQKDNLQFVRTTIDIEILANSEVIDEISTSFIGPNPWQKQNE
jgi:hypothetical protein